MKIKSLFFLLALSLFTSQAFAKENEIKTNINTELGTAKKDTREKIEPFDFAKLFSDAETYFKQAKSWQKLKCEPKSGFICTKHECKKRDIKATLVLDKKENSITRCEGATCETFTAQFNQTGVFFNVQTEGPIGTLIRVLGDNRYKEITTIGLDAYIANGNCEVVTEAKK